MSDPMGWPEAIAISAVALSAFGFLAFCAWLAAKGNRDD
jgi:hypothetical protein